MENNIRGSHTGNKLWRKLLEKIAYSVKKNMCVQEFSYTQESIRSIWYQGVCDHFSGVVQRRHAEGVL